VNFKIVEVYDLGILYWFWQRILF